MATSQSVISVRARRPWDLTVRFPSGALVKRELLTTLRRPPAFICLVVFVSACIFVSVARWPLGGIDPSIVGTFSRLVAGVILFVMLSGSALFVPAFAATTIVTEKEQQTFDMLSLTLIRPSGILMGKLLNTVGFFIILVIAGMPALGVVFFLVGVDWVAIAQSLALILVTIFSCAMIGILSSALFRRTSVAVVGAYLGVLTLMGGPVLLCVLGAFVLNLAPVPAILDLCSTITVPAKTLSDVVFGSTIAWPHYYGAVLYQLAISTVCYRLTLSVLRRPPRPPKVETRKPIDDGAVLEARRKTFPYYLIDPLRRKKPIEDDRNPMLVKELRWGAMGRSTTLIRVFYGAFIIFLLAAVIVVVNALYAWRRTWDYDESVLVVSLVQIGLAVLIAPALVANALTKEYEIGNLDMLRMTLLTPREIVLGKLFAAMISISPLLLAALLTSLPLAFVALFFPGSFAVLFTGYVTLVVCTFVSLSLALFASLLSRRTSTSLALSYLFSILVYIGTPFIFGGIAYILFYILLSPSVLSNLFPSLFRLLILTSPITAFYHTATGHLGRYVGLINLYWIGNIMTFSLLSGALIKYCVAAFARLGMRDR